MPGISRFAWIANELQFSRLVLARLRGTPRLFFVNARGGDLFVVVVGLFPSVEGRVTHVCVHISLDDTHAHCTPRE